MTPLATRLAARILRAGPISVADYMADCLMDPAHGYYATRDPLGAAGDFVTAPEISQMFGELVGLSLAQAWLDQGSPAPCALAELGPGRGTLMADILRATARVPGFTPEVHLVEASPVLRAAQARLLPGATWHDSVATLPDRALLVVANEFFDVLPVRQFRRAGQAWAERMVGLSGGALTWGYAPAAPQGALAHRLADTAEGDIVETCASGAAIAAELGARIAARGGAALIVDYGDWRSQGDTLQALARHAPADPLAAPGQADLTAHVDFEALAIAAAPARATRLTPQGVFLERLGITARAQALADTLSGQELLSHIAAHRRLTHPAEMGHLFKVMGLVPHEAPPPPGLAP